MSRYLNPFTDYGFKKLFGEAEITKLSADERTAYEDSLKYYRDIKNSLDTAFDEGKIEGKIEIAKNMILDGEPNEKIAKYTGLSMVQIGELRKEMA